MNRPGSGHYLGRRAGAGRRRLAAAAVGTLVATTALSGCFGDEADPSGSGRPHVRHDAAPSNAAPAAAPSAGESAGESAGASAGTGEGTSAPSAPASPRTQPASQGHGASSAVPTLPPGDPGAGAPSVPDPGTSGPEEDPAPPKRHVPRQAMVGTTNLDGILGGTWSAADTEPAACTTVEGAVAQRTVRYTEDASARSRSTVVETVSTYPSDDAADDAVGAMTRRWRGCGFDAAADPRMGTASAAAVNDDGWPVAVISAEGVLIVLEGHGSRTDSSGRWRSLMDIAMGNSCPAQPHGCD